MLRTMYIATASLTLLQGWSMAANTAAAAPAAKAESAAPAPVSDPAVIYQKNAFDPQRKPWSLPVEPAPAPPPPPPLTDTDVKIQGVWENGGTRKALVELSPKLLAQFETKPGKTPRPYKVVVVGDNLGGYTLKNISTKELTFEQGGVSSTVKFQVAKGRATAGASVAPPDQLALVVAAPVPVMANDAAAPAAANNPTPTPVPETNSVAPPAPAPIAQPTAATDTTGASNNNTTTPTPTTGAMGLLEAIEAARKNNTGQPVANPFAGLGK